MSKSRQSTLKSTIQECDSIRDVLKCCTYNSVAVFDIDNTILRPTHEEDLGSDQWFRRVLDRAFFKISHRPVALNSTIVLNNKIQEHIKIKPVEAVTPRIIKILQDLSLPTIAVSARRYDAALTTIKQLNNINVNFSKDVNEKSNFQLEGKNIHFENGVLFCDGVNKGLCLSAYLKIKGIDCCDVVMLDDVQENLVKVRDVMSSQRFSFQGLRYSQTDTRVFQFDLKRANVKLSSVSLFFSRSVVDFVEALDLEGYQQNLDEQPDIAEGMGRKSN